MVDNRGITPVTSGFNFKSGDISGTAAKTSDEKMGQGTEYFAQEQYEQDEQEKQNFQDRSAQLRASLDSLALANAGSMRLMKTLQEKRNKEKRIQDEKEENSKKKQKPHEYLYDE